MPARHAVVAVPIPDESRVRLAYATTDLADAYETRLPEGAIHEPEALARFIFTSRPSWVAKLMWLRDGIVRGFGLKTADGLLQSTERRIGLFRIYGTTSTQIVLGEDDSHLDFRVSVQLRSESLAGGSANFVVVSTVVHCHNLLGRSYIFFIAPFHRLVVKAGLRRAARLGWPMQVPGKPPLTHPAGT
jgi:Protein of unknown function (DUF2867)